jgi:adenine-specific DNA-methyltransferase
VETDNQRFNATVQPNSAFLAELKEKLPEFFTRENSFDLEKFQAALKEKNVSELSEGYQLNFIGKDYARRQAGEMPTTVIVPDEDQNNGAGKNSQNLFFTGDNLEVLRHLQNNYQNKIDVIYIDPPYNTGNDGFVYPDSFEYSDDKLKEMFGMNDDQVARLKSIQGRSSHSAWLTFMYPRLFLAKKLLSDTGVIFISIDDNEQANIKLLMNEIFGESNFLTDFIWEKTQHFGRQKINSYNNADHVLAFIKNSVQEGSLAETLVEFEKREFEDAPLYNASNNISTLEFPYGSVKFNIPDGEYLKTTDKKYELLSPVVVKNGKNINNFKLRFRSRWSSRTISKELEKGTKFWIKTQNFAVRAIYGNGKISTEAPKQIIFTKNNSTITKDRFGNHVGTSENATSYVKKILGGEFFSYPKPVSLIEYLISLYYKNHSYPNDFIVLDFFAGSSTTADAVMQLNAEDGGHRKFIMVQLPEKTYHTNSDGSEVPTKGGKAAYEAGFRSIDEISRERIRRAAAKIKADNELTLPADFDGSFKHYRVVKPSRMTLERIEEFKPDTDELVLDTVTAFSSDALGVAGNASGEQTVLATWLAKDGYAFDADIQKIDLAGYQGNLVENNRLYLICENWGSKCTEKLLNLLGTHALNLQAVVIFGYSFNLNDLRELENGLKQLDSNVSLIKRY